ncbi:MAG TPA: hypothetical protein VE421_13345 [Burkholderiaceae bacterium]|nr:hypothetical protein [Burkholderiaceae bacterium]
MKNSGEKRERDNQSGTARSEQRRSEELAGTKRRLATDDPAATPRQLRQPHERDESADDQLTGTRRVIKQAHDDLQSGQQDTDARNRIPEILPNVPKTPQNFDESDPVDTAPRSKKNATR